VTVTSGEKGPTRADIAQLPVAHAQNILPNRAPSCHVTFGHFRSSMRTVSLPVAPPQMRLEPYPYTTGITVLTVISKIVETIIKARIQNQVLEIQSRTG
jgi:hypothetical protein